MHVQPRLGSDGRCRAVSCACRATVPTVRPPAHLCPAGLLLQVGRCPLACSATYQPDPGRVTAREPPASGDGLDAELAGRAPVWSDEDHAWPRAAWQEEGQREARWREGEEFGVALCDRKLVEWVFIYEFHLCFKW